MAKDPELFSRELERAVEIAYELGAKVVNHYCYHVAMGPEISFSELEKYYGRAIRKAKHRKIYLALENEAHDITQSPEGMKTIVEHMNSEYFKTNISKIVQTRENVKEQLRDLGFECTDSKANFLFVTHPRYDALKLFEELKEAGIYVRHWNDPKIKDYLRITIGTDEEMKIFLDFLKKKIGA